MPVVRCHPSCCLLGHLPVLPAPGLSWCPQRLGLSLPGHETGEGSERD